jgi:aspartyl-tRNA synthetase
VPKIPFKRVTYSQIIKELEANKVHINWGEDIPTPAYRVLGKLHPEFYFITDWPPKPKRFTSNQKTTTLNSAKASI